MLNKSNVHQNEGPPALALRASYANAKIVLSSGSSLMTLNLDLALTIFAVELNARNLERPAHPDSAETFSCRSLPRILQMILLDKMSWNSPLTAISQSWRGFPLPMSDETRTLNRRQRPLSGSLLSLLFPIPPYLPLNIHFLELAILCSPRVNSPV